MTRSSASRVNRRRRRDGIQKKRQEHIYATTTVDASGIGITYDLHTDEVRFDVPVDNTYVETTYARKKAPKIVNRVPLQGKGLQFDLTQALLQNYELLIALDTNTTQISGRKTSVTGAIVSKVIKRTDGSQDVAWHCPLCVELTEVVTDLEERVGWIEGLRALHAEGHITAHQRIGLVVDAHLGDLPAFNARTQAIYGQMMLPENVTLIYASSDTGSEYLANSLLRGADRSAAMVIEYLKAGKAPPNEAVLRNMPFQARRVIFPRQVDSLEVYPR